MTTSIGGHIYDGSGNYWEEIQEPTGAANVDVSKFASSGQVAWAGQFGGFDLTSSSATNSITARSYVFQTLTLTLAPHTGLVAESLLSMTAHQGTARSSWLQSVHFSISPANSMAGQYKFERYLSSRPFGPDDLDSNERISLSYVNTSDVARDVTLFINNYNSTATAGLVPEPATYAMLGAGLLALGLHARRRRTS